jgi:hypothetical protein
VSSGPLNHPLGRAELLVLEDRPNEMHRIEVAPPEKRTAVVIVQHHIVLHLKASEKDRLSEVGGPYSDTASSQRRISLSDRSTMFRGLPFAGMIS